MGTDQEVGFWKPQTMRYCQDEKVQFPHSKSVISPQLENLLPAGAVSVDWLELRPFQETKDFKAKYHIGGYQEGTVNFSRASGGYINSNQKSRPNLYFEGVSCSREANKPNIKGTQPGNSLSSSMSTEVFGRKLGLSLNNVLFHKSADAFCHEEEEPFGSMEEMEAQTIGNLLPDEADLFSGVIDGLEYISDAKGGDDGEDFDLFISVGGMELEVDGASRARKNGADFTWEVPSSQGSSKGSLAGTHPYGEHPSRTLFVRNLSSDVEDSDLRVLFEQYGDIRNLYTACKQRGFVMISYFDLRAAKNAMRALQDKQLGHRKLDIHYSIPKDNPLEKDINQGAVLVFDLNTSVSDDDLRHIFGIYGEIKEIREVSLKSHHKFVEFYDVRAAEAACRALNKCNVTGKQAGRQWCSELEQDEVGMSISSNDISSSESMPIFSNGGRTVSCFHNGFVRGLQCAGCATLSTLTENVVSHGSFSGLNSLLSQPSVASSENHFGLHKPCHSLDQLKFGSKCIKSSHSHSFPDCHDNFEISRLHNCSSAVANMAGNNSSEVLGRTNGRHTSMVVSNGQPVELNGGVSGSSGNATCPVYGHHWSNSNAFQPQPSRPMAWPSSPLFSSSGNDLFTPQLPAFSRMPPELLKHTVSPPHHLHGGSAPSSKPSFCDRRHVYRGDSPEDLAFGLRSLESAGFRGSSPLHQLGRASRVFSRAVGHCMEKSKIDVLHSPHQMPGKNTINSLPTSFRYPQARGRSLSHRRNQGSCSHAEKKQFELDTECILRGEDSRTTLMLKNIPNKYTSKMLLTTIDENCRGTYDFIYLPIDFKNKCNVGYAFINLIDPLQIVPFYKAFNGKKWEKFNSEKVAALAYARIQGKSSLIAHFQNSSLMNEDKRCRPILFCTNGPNAGEQEPFPMGTNIRLKAGKARSSVAEEIDHQGSPSSSVNGEDSPNRSDSSGSVRESY